MRAFAFPRPNAKPSTVEIGYTDVGPILNVQLAFISKNKNAIIKQLDVELTHEGNEQQKLTWYRYGSIMYNREYRYNTSSNSETKNGYYSDSSISENDVNNYSSFTINNKVGNNTISTQRNDTAAGK